MTTRVNQSSGNPQDQSWQEAFLKLLPAIQQSARFLLQHLRPEAREDAVHEVTASAVVAYRRLVELGKTDLAYPSVLARYAVAHFHSGRRVGSRLNGEDVTSHYAQRRQGFRLGRLDHYDQQEGWMEILVEDKRATPAEIAASRVDFAAWLESLTVRYQRMARLLATGESTSVVAQQFGISPGRVSQIRRELEELWTAFAGEKQAGAAAA